MELRFVESESTFDYFASTASYVRRFGKPWRSTATSTASFVSLNRGRAVATRGAKALPASALETPASRSCLTNSFGLATGGPLPELMP